ncbi:MAG TPA: protein translocase subunit SecDF [Puia sp.]|jgi:SecD/SecF fusion protein|nr:protein translocase subunit SecDF [Puia sp.]
MRALVSIFAALLIIISLYQLSFTWFVNSHESAMEAKAKQLVKRVYPQTAEQKYPAKDMKEARAAYNDTLDQAYNHIKDSLLKATGDTKITWWGTTYQKSKESELLLGLDLQGGISVTLNIALQDLVKNLSNNPRDPQLLRAISMAQQKELTNPGNFIDLFAESYKEINPSGKLAPLFSNSNSNKLTYDASDAAIVSYLHDQASAAMRQTYQVINQRINQFGVAQPSISLDENRAIINVELAGATDPERVRNYLQSTANLQFWDVYTLQDQAFATSFSNADKALQAYLNGVRADTTAADSAGKAKKDSSASTLNQNALFAVLHPTLDRNMQPTSSSAIGTALLKDTPKVNAYLALPVVRNSFPTDLKFLWGKQQLDADGKPVPVLEMYAIKTIPGQDKARLEGGEIENARQDFDPTTGGVIVEMSMKKAGTKIWADMTTKDATGHRPIAIVLDDIVYSAPSVDEPITGGNSQIRMGGANNQQTVQEATDLANILNSGKLSAPARIVSDEVVGPTLGRAAVNGGMMAFGISFLVIFTLMLVYYNTGGWVANSALILNLLFTVGVLSALHATLTAPGIAGLVLTIGMAVDTNVIIFERIKEELTRGKSYPLAIKDGYRRSLPPVLDAHVTTLLTALILFYFGLGPVRGFATTQILGILLSLFCGILISRLITDFYTNKNRHLQYFTGLSRRIFKHAAFKFIEYRRVAYGISVVVLIMGVSSLIHGFKKGVEFQGGRSYIVNFHRPIAPENVRNSLEKAFPGTSPEIKTYGGNEQLEITTDYKIKDPGNTDSVVLSALYSGVNSYLPQNTSYSDFLTTKFLAGTKKVEPVISEELEAGAVRATIFALIIIFLYIFVRFRDWRYSLGTIISLLHDVFVTLTVFSFAGSFVHFSLEIDQHFIAAILTVIGFSMNDTVIVFDRIRENSHLMKNATNGEIINKSVNDTLSRTIMTSLTVFLTILILFLVGGEVTRGFAFAMLIGVITGTYSSIFVAAPFLVDFAKGKPLGEQPLTAGKPGAGAEKAAKAAITATKS